MVTKAQHFLNHPQEDIFMDIQVKGNHVEITSALKDYTSKKVEKLERFSDNVQRVVVDLIIEETTDINERHVCHATVYAAGSIMRAEERSKDMYATIDLLLEKLEVQLKRYNEKQKDHKSESLKREFTTVGSDSGNNTPKVKRLSRDDLFVPKPTEVEEAVRLLRERKTPFLAFRNFKEKISIIFPIDKDEYGLLEPDN